MQSLGTRRLTLTSWWLPIVVAVAVCVGVGATTAAWRRLRLHYGDYRADVAGGVLIVCLMSYIVIGAGIAIFGALGTVVPPPEIEYDSHELLR